MIKFNLRSCENTVVNLLPHCQLSDIACPKKLLKCPPSPTVTLWHLFAKCDAFYKGARNHPGKRFHPPTTLPWASPFQKGNAQIDGVVFEKVLPQPQSSLKLVNQCSE